MKKVVLLALVVFFFHSHVVDLLSNLNETIRRFPRPIRHRFISDGDERRRQVGGGLGLNSMMKVV